MQEFQDFIARPGHHRAGLGLGRALLAQQYRLCEFDIPVAIDVPDEAVDRVGRIVETIALEGLRDLARGARRLMCDPAVQGFLCCGRIEACRLLAAVHLGEAAGVPQLGREIAIGFDQLRR